MEQIEINNKKYIFIHDYKDNEVYRKIFNELTNQIWEFDYESWYKCGYWDGKTHLYSLLDGDKMVSHITVTEFDCIVLGNRQKAIQLGTVMTDVEYRNLGLNKILMDKVLEEWKGKSDMMYLYANDTVLEYYPKFGFSAVDEYQATREATSCTIKHVVRKMNIDDLADLSLLQRISKLAKPLYDLSIVDNLGLTMFYCYCIEVIKHNLYYIENLDSIAVAEYDGDTVIVNEVLSSNTIDIEEVINSLVVNNTKKISLQFMPQNKNGYDIRLYKEEDLTLFVSSDKAPLFENNKLIFPILAHT